MAHGGAAQVPPPHGEEYIVGMQAPSAIAQDTTTARAIHRERAMVAS